MSSTVQGEKNQTDLRDWCSYKKLIRGAPKTAQGHVKMCQSRASRLIILRARTASPQTVLDPLKGTNPATHSCHTLQVPRFANAQAPFWSGTEGTMLHIHWP